MEADALHSVRLRYRCTGRGGVDSIVLACEDLFGRHTERFLFSTRYTRRNLCPKRRGWRGGRGSGGYLNCGGLHRAFLSEA